MATSLIVEVASSCNRRLAGPVAQGEQRGEICALACRLSRPACSPYAPLLRDELPLLRCCRERAKTAACWRLSVRGQPRGQLLPPARELVAVNDIADVLAAMSDVNTLVLCTKGQADVWERVSLGSFTFADGKSPTHACSLTKTPICTGAQNSYRKAAVSARRVESQRLKAIPG